MKRLVKRMVSMFLAFAMFVPLLSFSNSYHNVRVYAATDIAANFTPSENCISLIFGIEKFSPNCYPDGDHYSIGYGTTCNGDHSNGAVHTISEPEANRIARTQILGRYKQEVVRATGSLQMNQNQFDALVSQAYNHGNVLPNGCSSCGYTKQPLVQYLMGNLTESQARAQIVEWCIRSNGVVAPGLITRRQKECNLFFTPINDTPHLTFSTDCSKPSGKLTQGKPFGISGSVSSYPNLSRVWGGVYNQDGSQTKQFRDINPNSTFCNLAKDFDPYIIFNDLPVGFYIYRIEAKTTDGQYDKIESTFQIGDPPKPSNVKLSIPKTEYMKGDKIVFTPSGTNVTGGYTIGIDDASGNRLITQTFAVGSTYSTSSLASGNYSAYVTAYNGSGYTDSGRIYFSVGITATFNANGGSCGTASKRVVTGDKYGDLPKPTRSGYSFVGWYTSDSGGSQVTSSTVVTSGSNHTLYAHWTADDYTVVFNKNNGSGSMSNQTIARDQSVALTANTFTRTGYSFSNWNTKADGSGTSYSNKASVKNLVAGGGSITLYAIWKANTYTIKYDANTGSGSMDNSTMTYDKAGNLRKNTYTRTGYSFESWSDGNGNYYADQASVKNLATSGTVTLWVKWKPNTYKVTLDDGSGKTTTINVTYDGKYNGLTEPVQDGYNFAGWYTEKDGKGTLISKDTTVKITSNQTLYAHWSREKIRISFNANGGTSEMSQKLVSYDTKFGVLPNAEKAGYDFGGWYLDEGLTQQITADSIVKITKNQEVYAKWVQIKLTVTFNPNGGTVDVETKKVVSGKVYGVLPEAEKDGFEFVGWFTEGGTEITSDSTVEFTEDTTVYAKWRLKGDVDADGDVDIDDVIMLQQWLLAVPDATLNDWCAGDLCQDERIDVFDLCLLKRLLLERNGGIE